MSGRGGKRTGAGATTKAARLAKDGAQGAPSVMAMFRPGASTSDATTTASGAAGSCRSREPGTTPSKAEVSRARVEAPAEKPGASAEAPEDVQIVGERTWAERDEAGRAAAISLDADDDASADAAGFARPFVPKRQSPPSTADPEPVPKRESPTASTPEPPIPKRESLPAPLSVDVEELTGMLSRFSAGVSETLQQGATMLTERLGLSTRSLSSTFASEVSSLRSDLRLEIATLRRESVSAARAVLDDVAEQRRSLAQEREEFAESKRFASDREWLVLLPSGNYICIWCDTHHHQLSGQGFGRFLESPWIRRNGGVKVSARFSDQAGEHENAAWHTRCWALEEDREASPLLHAFRIAEKEADEVTCRIFRMVLDPLPLPFIPGARGVVPSSNLAHAVLLVTATHLVHLHAVHLFPPARERPRDG